MLGVPFEAQDQFRKWSNPITESVNNPPLMQDSEEAMMHLSSI